MIITLHSIGGRCTLQKGSDVHATGDASSVVHTKPSCRCEIGKGEDDACSVQLVDLFSARRSVDVGFSKHFDDRHG